MFRTKTELDHGSGTFSHGAGAAIGRQDRRSRRSCRLFVVSLLTFLLFVLGSTEAFSQTEQPELPEGVVPPPLNVISKQEKADLEAERKISNRTKLALEFMDDRLSKSEEYAGKDDFQESLNQLGRFQALVKNTLWYLQENEDDKGSFKNFKRFEMTLRQFLPRLELLHRNMPFRYGYHFREMIKFVRDARTNALEPLFADTVIPEGGSR